MKCGILGAAMGIPLVLIRAVGAYLRGPIVVETFGGYAK